METIHAIYEGGVFRPVQPVQLPEKCEVEFEPRIVDGDSRRDMEAVYQVLDRRHSTGINDLAAR